MPRYAALVYVTESARPAPDTPEQEEEVRLFGAFIQEVMKAGVMKGGEGFHPVATATVRVRDGKIAQMDGPFAETSEQLGGFFVLECRDLDEAVQWAAMIPNATRGSVELRPLIEM